MSGAPAPEQPSLPAFFRRFDFDHLASTNDEAKRLARAGAPEGCLVVARRQTGGRGRRGRSWESPAGNLYCSLLLRPESSLAEAAQISFVAAVALAEALSGWLEAARIGLKWPNDVLVDGAKVSGILLESEAGAVGRCDWLVVGMGVNIESAPVGLTQAVSALAEVARAPVNVEAVLGALAPAFLSWYDRWRREGFAPVRSAWLARAAFVGEPIGVQLADGALQGRFEDLATDGSLVLRLDDGSTRPIGAGEIHALTD
ncbi:MAG: biotin--[acetyl-CoA-carboxylase] ligase [Alphaproteobacteria bacterium]|nr:biotin--[acetyl-CoA-carboxylase] ligase [Alphaproteobacteria bacterium]